MKSGMQGQLNLGDNYGCFYRDVLGANHFKAE